MHKYFLFIVFGAAFFPNTGAYANIRTSLHNPPAMTHIHLARDARQVNKRYIGGFDTEDECKKVCRITAGDNYWYCTRCYTIWDCRIWSN